MSLYRNECRSHTRTDTLAIDCSHLPPKGIHRRDFILGSAKSAPRCQSAPADASHFLKSASWISLSSAPSAVHSRLPTGLDSRRERLKKISPLVCATASQNSHLLQSFGEEKINCRAITRHQSSKKHAFIKWLTLALAKDVLVFSFPI